MAKTMTPSTQKEMTDGQLDKAVSAYRDMLRKHRPELGSEAVQTILSSDNYVNEQVGILRRFVEAISNLIHRTTSVNRTRTPQEALDATKRAQYTNGKVVNGMPKGEGEEVEVVFFKLGRYVSDNDLEKEYELRGLTPADPYSLAAVNEADPAFADEHPNGTHWKDADGRWCFVAFDGSYDERSVRVGRGDCGWRDCWWFAGVRKV